MNRRNFLQAAAAFGLLGGKRLWSLDERSKQHAEVVLVDDPRFKQHDTGKGHPERPERIDAVRRGIEASGVATKLERIHPRAATKEEILTCHAQEYLETVHRDVKAGAARLSTGDTAIGAASLEIAQLAAGGVLAAVDRLFTGPARRAFCAVRPPGHHATPKRGMGFCIFNNVALAARYAQRKHKVAKVLIVDWDVHHGNGTQDVFYSDPSVFFFSTHQSPWYPGTGASEETGAGKGLGTTLNQPFPAGAGRKEILGAFENKLAPAVAKFRPELVIVSAGFDSRRGDPLGRFQLMDRDFADLTKLLRGLAAEHAEGRVLSVLEGGYNLEGLASAVAAHLRALA